MDTYTTLSELIRIFTSIKALVSIVALLAFLAFILPKIDYIGDHTDEAVDIGIEVIEETVKQVAGPEAIRAEFFWILAGITVTAIAGIVGFLRQFS